MTKYNKEYRDEYFQRPGKTEQRKAYMKEYNKKYKKEYIQRPGVKEHVQEYKKKYNKEYNLKQESKDKQQEYKWKRQGIDITREGYEVLLEEQNGNCAICGRNESEFKKRLQVDHCHATGEIRGLLCWSCNSALGKVKDNVDILASAVSYLQQ